MLLYFLETSVSTERSSLIPQWVSNLMHNQVSYINYLV